MEVTADKRTFILLVRQVPQPIEGFPQYTMATTTITSVAAAKEAKQSGLGPTWAWLVVELGVVELRFRRDEAGATS